MIQKLINPTKTPPISVSMDMHGLVYAINAPVGPSPIALIKLNLD
jgi:hypothetical protein